LSAGLLFSRSKITLGAPGDEHPALSCLGIKPVLEPLYVITVVENPIRWQSRYRNFWNFQKHITDSGAHLVTVELAYGSELFHCTSASDP